MTLKAPPFEYVAATTVAEAIKLMEEVGPDAKFLAGGQSLVPLMNLRLARPRVLIDINGLDELSGIHKDDGQVIIGALTRQRALEFDPIIAQHLPLLKATVRYIGHPQIRNRGTIGGSLAHNDPAAELPALMLLYEADIMASGPQGERVIPARDFFRGYLSTALTPGELLTRIRVPLSPPRTGGDFQEVSRRLGDFALVGVGALVTVDDSNRIDEARLVVTGVGSSATRVAQAEAILKGEPPSERLFAEAARRLSEAIEPESDIHASAEYRRRVAGVLTRRTLEQAVQKARGGKVQ